MKAFISYSHKDEHFLERLKVHLAPIKRDKIIEEWSDVEIPAGSTLNSSINEALETSQIFIALISPDYLASTYCHDIEFKRAQLDEVTGAVFIDNQPDIKIEGVNGTMKVYQYTDPFESYYSYVSSSPANNISSFYIYSFGPDKNNDSGASISDDITNW